MNSRAQKHIYSNGNLQEVVHFRKTNNTMQCNEAEKEVISLL